MKTFIVRQPPSNRADDLARVKWSAILSLDTDSAFDDQVRQYADRRAAGQLLTVVSNLRHAIPPRTIPLFKLLGSILRDDFVHSTVDYRLRKLEWRQAIYTFSDLVRESPVVCVGMDACPWALFDLLAEMTWQPSFIPTSLVFVSEDGLAADPKIRQLLRGRTRVVIAGASTTELAKSASDAQLAFLQQSGAPTDGRFADFRTYAELAVLVNEHLQTSVGADQRHQLLDLLFSTDDTRWDPFVYDLDFRRTIYESIKTQVIDAAENDRPVACVVTGNAASGKTTLLKRIAFDLAKDNYLVVWFRPWFYQDSQRVLQQMMKSISSMRGKDKRPVFVFADDPIALGCLTPSDICIAAEGAGVPVVLVAGVRTSDWTTREQSRFVGPLSVAAQVAVPDELDAQEWMSLPKYLTALGIARSTEDAETQVRVANSRSTKDTLSMLYWLLPETRQSITRSIRDEYFRLGDGAGLRKIIVGGLEHSSDSLKRAYEMVAVADHYRTALPVEVLVSALGVQYEEWLDATRSDGPAWGLLYGNVSVEAESVSYRPRNTIVTRTIVETINGGTLGHAGELRVLSSLLAACKGSQPAYREFCVRILVRSDTFHHLEYAEGLKLFDIAMSALPLSDKTLLHHKGRWIKNEGHDPIAATEVLTMALATEPYPYASRSEVDEHIFTTLAATQLDAIDKNLVNLEDGKNAVLQYLARARSEYFFNANAVHVEANLILRLIRKLGESHVADVYALITEALADVDRTILVLSGLDDSGELSKDLAMLEAVRDQIFVGTKSAVELKDEAERLWKEYGRQDGFIVVARKLYRTAVGSGKGTDYKDAYTYCREAIARVEQAGDVPSSAMHEVIVHIYYTWRLSSRGQGRGAYEIDWKMLREHLRHVLQSPRGPDYAFYDYIWALCAAHLGDWTEANRIFGQLRAAGMPTRMLREARGYLLDASGQRRQVQGRITEGGIRNFLYVEDLQTDFYLLRDRRWPAEGEIAHAYIEFSFAGPTAIPAR